MRMVSRVRCRTNQSLTLSSQLEEDQTEDQQVTLADQTNINAFSRLNNRSEELTDLLETLKRELEELEEVETEIELMDDEGLVMSVPHTHVLVSIHLTHSAVGIAKKNPGGNCN